MRSQRQLPPSELQPRAARHGAMAVAPHLMGEVVALIVLTHLKKESKYSASVACASETGFVNELDWPSA